MTLHRILLHGFRDLFEVIFAPYDIPEVLKHALFRPVRNAKCEHSPCH